MSRDFRSPCTTVLIFLTSSCSFFATCPPRAMLNKCDSITLNTPSSPASHVGPDARRSLAQHDVRSHMWAQRAHGIGTSIYSNKKAEIPSANEQPSVRARAASGRAPAFAAPPAQGCVSHVKRSKSAANIKSAFCLHYPAMHQTCNEEAARASETSLHHRAGRWRRTQGPGTHIHLND